MTTTETDFWEGATGAWILQWPEWVLCKPPSHGRRPLGPRWFSGWLAAHHQLTLAGHSVPQSLPSTNNSFLHLCCCWEEWERTIYLPLTSKGAWACRLRSWQGLLSRCFPFVVSGAAVAWGMPLPFVPKGNKGSERGGKTPLASDSSGALNSSPLWARLVLANTWKGTKRPLQSPQMLGLSFLLSGPLMLSWARLARLVVICLVFEIAVLPQTTETWPATHPRSSRYLEGWRSVCWLLCSRRARVKAT